MAITYPVDTENTKWAVYKISTSEIIRKNADWPTADGSEIPGLDNDLAMLLETKATPPAYDSATQKLEHSETVDVVENSVVYGWNAVALTQEEINARTPTSFTTSGGIKLAVEEQDQNAFARMNTLIDLAGMADTDSITIKDIDGISHEITVTEFKAIMVAYGNYCYSQFLS